MLEYKELDLYQHTLARPDTYIGSIRSQISEEYIVGENGNHIIRKEIQYTPAIERLFIEILANTFDNQQRSIQSGIPFKRIDVTVNKTTGECTVVNDGLTIPVTINENGVYIPELIFGRLLTSSNYDDSELRTTSGKNGIGATCANIFSSAFSVIVEDTIYKKTYRQSWSNNMMTCNPPTITSFKKKYGSTTVQWIPDCTYFEQSIERIYTDDFVSLLHRHVVDLAATTGVAVTFNGESVYIASPKNYSMWYYAEPYEQAVFTDKCSTALLVCSSEYKYEQISFVNGIRTKDGGIHVDMWIDTLFKQGIVPALKKYTLRDIKSYFQLYVFCQLPNPEFTSQAKTKCSGPRVTIPEQNINKILKWSFVRKLKEKIVKEDQLQGLKQEKKKAIGRIDGYDAAHKAGGKDSRKCVLLITEGLSAKTYAVEGISKGLKGSVKGREYIGVYPVRGKLLNVRNVSLKKALENKEISDLVSILGLRSDKDYSLEENFKTLRYGKLIGLTDQDHDGFHILALLMNFFDVFYPSLLKRGDFFGSMPTPILKAITTKGISHRFYDLEEGKEFIKQHKCKQVIYYKGLGTARKEDIHATFGELVRQYIQDNNAIDNMDKTFSKSRANERKEWLQNYALQEQSNSLRQEPRMDISDFINHELVLFSIDDCARSIPHLMDGLKQSQRKTLYACFKRNLTTDLKVAQLAGYISEHTGYHHGEVNLHGTIIKMAQNYVGSNNIPLLLPEGAFGTRHYNGGDAANARYIYTRLAPITRLIYNKNDDVLCTSQEEEGMTIEPMYYVPIIPMILVNGVDTAIGTGFSSTIPSYNPVQIIDWICSWLENPENVEMSLHPWVNNFKGTINQCSGKYISRGNSSTIIKGSKRIIHVTELPVGMSIDTFKTKVAPHVDTVKDQSTSEIVDILLETTTASKWEFSSIFTTLSTTNMVLFNPAGILTKYNTVDEILQEWCTVRLDFYGKRIEYQLRQNQAQLKNLRDKLDFIKGVLNKSIPLESSDEKLEKILHDRYRHLDFLTIPIRQLTRGKVQRLEEEIKAVEKTIKELGKTTPKALWKVELEDLKLLLSN